MPLHDMCSLVMVGLDLAVTAQCPARGAVTLLLTPQNWAAFGVIGRGSHQKQKGSFKKIKCMWMDKKIKQNQNNTAIPLGGGPTTALLPSGGLKGPR